MKNKSEQYFTINKNTPILLLGYTQYAREIAESLVKRSYCVKGYIDNNAKQLSCDKLPVYLLKELEDFSWHKEAVVIICLQNIRTQIEAAEQTLREGKINKIIFLPDTGLFDRDMAGKMRRVYQKVCLQEKLTNYLIPKYDVMRCDKEGIIVARRFRNCFCILCPIQLIFTGYKDKRNAWQFKDSEIYTKMAEQYEDKNITLNRLYNIFFDYMMYGIGNYDAYIEIYSKITQKSKDLYLNDRIELFKLYESEYEKDNSFFMETAAIAEWNPQGYFNLKDGHHRVSFLYKKGHILIPIIISNTDFNSYYNYEASQKLKNFLADHNITKIPNVEIQQRFIQNSQFDYQVRKVIAIWRVLFEDGCIENSSYLDASNCLGFWGINMKRMHAGHVEVMITNILEEKLLYLILKLTYQDTIILKRREEIDDEYDVVFAEETSVGQADIVKLYNKTKKYFFFDFKRNDEVTRNHINAVKGAKYQKIIEYFNGKDWMESGCMQIQRKI